MSDDLHFSGTPSTQPTRSSDMTFSCASRTTCRIGVAAARVMGLSLSDTRGTSLALAVVLARRGKGITKGDVARAVAGRGDKQNPLSSAQERLGGPMKLWTRKDIARKGFAALLRNFMDWIHEAHRARQSRMLFHDIPAPRCVRRRVRNASSTPQPGQVARMEAEGGCDGAPGKGHQHGRHRKPWPQARGRIHPHCERAVRRSSVVQIHLSANQGFLLAVLPQNVWLWKKVGHLSALREWGKCGIPAPSRASTLVEPEQLNVRFGAKEVRDH